MNRFGLMLVLLASLWIVGLIENFQGGSLMKYLALSALVIAVWLMLTKPEKLRRAWALAWQKKPPRR